MILKLLLLLLLLLLLHHVRVLSSTTAEIRHAPVFEVILTANIRVQVIYKVMLQVARGVYNIEVVIRKRCWGQSIYFVYHKLRTVCELMLTRIENLYLLMSESMDVISGGMVKSMSKLSLIGPLFAFCYC